MALGFYTFDTDEYVSTGDTFYLVEPEGENTKIENYSGMYESGEVELLSWVAKHNLPEDFNIQEEYDISKHCEPENLRENIDMDMILSTYGLAIHSGIVYEDINTKEIFSYHYSFLFKKVIPFTGKYGVIMPPYGKSPNDLIEEGIWVEKNIRNFLIPYKKPLKFSLNKDAVYADNK